MNYNPKILLVRSLAETLFWAKKCYYDGHYGFLNFSITDETYDKLEETLKSLCPNHPVLSAVGSPDFSFLLGMVETRKLVEPADDALDSL
jgi:hypothetical protein